IKILHVVDSVRHPAGPKRRLEARAEQHPEHQRLKERARQAAALPREPRDLAPPERARLKRDVHGCCAASADGAKNRWPVRWTNTSSSVGLPKVTDSISPPNASTTSRTSSCPRWRSIRMVPSTSVARTLNCCAIL